MSALMKLQEIGVPSTIPSYMLLDGVVGPFCIADPKYLYQDWKGETPVTADGDLVGLLRDYRRPIEPVKAVMPGHTGSFISTPDSAAVSITGDIEIVLDISMEDWTPATVQLLLAKWQSTGSQRSYYVALSTSGSLIFSQSVDGMGTITSFESTTPVPFSNGQRGMIKASFDSDNGASGRTVAFYTSDDSGDNWSQLGDPVTVAGVSGCFDSTAMVQLGAYLAGTTLNMAGSYYRAEIYNGIGGTLVACFDSDDYVSGATLDSSDTGETWTKNGLCDFCVGETHFYTDDDDLRPTYRTDGHAHWLEFTGSQGLRTAPVDFTQTTKITVLASAYKELDGSSGVLIDLGTNPTTVPGTFVVAISDPSYKFVSTTRSSEGVTSGVSNDVSLSALQRLSIVTEHQTDGTTAEQMRSLRANGVEIDLTSTVENLPGSGSFSRRPLFLGARAQSSLFMTAKLYSIAVLSDHFEASSILGAEAWLDEVSASLIDNPSEFMDSANPVDMSTHWQTSQFAQLQYQTDATQMEVLSWNNMYSSYASFTRIGVYVNGEYNQSIEIGANGESTDIITLPAGTKTVSLVNGPQTRPSTAAPAKGTFVTRVIAKDGTLKLSPAPQNRLLIYGDSITAGDASDPVMEKAWVMQVRTAAAGDSVAMEGWGYRTLHEDANSELLRTSFVSKLTSYAPLRIWLAIGTNDYALNKWSAANFGVAFNALLDDLVEAMPNITIYCQTPLVRVSEVANSFGDTLGDYRSEIVTAVSTRTDNCILIDGTEILEVGDLNDNVHPTTAGHTKYANYVISALGY